MTVTRRQSLECPKCGSSESLTHRRREKENPAEMPPTVKCENCNIAFDGKRHWKLD